MTDPIADMLTRIRNANAVAKKTVDIPYSKINAAIAKVLQQEGYITSFEVTETNPQATLTITLRYLSDKPVINSIKRVSSPGRRVYTQAKYIKNILAGMGITIISTSKGVMTNSEARAKKLGGEIICEVW